MPEDSQTVVNRIQNELQRLGTPNKFKGRGEVDQRFRECIDYAVKQAFIHAGNKRKPEDVVAQLMDNDLNQQASYRHFREGLDTLYARDKKTTNELNQLRIVENAQGRRNTLWRFVSTLAVGGAILLIYAAGELFGIALPLSGIK